MSEHSMARIVMDVLRDAGLDPVRVENPCHPGTPDINYADGWIELKELRSWPRRIDTIVRVPHFTPQQRVWLERRCRKGGRAWVLVKVRAEWLLLCGATAARLLGLSTEEELRRVSVVLGTDELASDTTGLVHWLRLA